MELVDRYLQAVKFWLPKARRQDIIAELAEDIRSQIEEKEAELGRALNEDESSALLKRRGSPFSVAERYLPQRSLIGPGLFPLYALSLKFVGLAYLIPWLLVWLFLIVFVPSFRAAHPGWALIATLETFWHIAFYSFSLITLGFGVAERIHQQKKFRSDWNPGRLPPVRDKQRIPRSFSILEVMANIIFLTWWLGWSSFPAVVLQDGSRWTAGRLWQSFHSRFYWPVVVLALVAATFALINLIRPHWTRVRLGIRAALNAFGAAMLALALSGYFSEFKAQWVRMAATQSEWRGAEAVRSWTEISVFLILLFACILCFISCLWGLHRVVRWKALLRDAGKSLAVVIVISLSITAAGAQTTASVQAEGPSALSDEAIRRILVERIDVQHWGVGIVVGLVTPGGRKLICYGRRDQHDSRPLDGQTVFEIGSITKVFTSLVLADMAGRGEVALTDPLAKYLPESVSVPEWKGHKITLVDLATQTSGLPFFPTDIPLFDDPAAAARELASYPIQKLYAFLSGYELLHDIGVNWEYSNLGVGLMGLALSRRAGTNYEGLVQSRVAGPLGMQSTGLAGPRAVEKNTAVGHDDRLNPTPSVDFPEFLAGAGSLRSTANDLLTFLEAFLGYKNTALAPAMKAMLETRRPGSDWLAFLGGEQALGWWVIGQGDDKIIAHSGETMGFSSSVAYNPKTRVGAVVLSNCIVGGTDLAMHLVRPSYPLSKPGGELKKRQEITVAPGLFDRYAGKYQIAPNAILVIRREGDKLSFMAPGSPRSRLHPETERDYFIDGADVQVTFQVDAQGRVTGLILHLYGQFNIPGKKMET